MQTKVSPKVKVKVNKNVIIFLFIFLMLLKAFAAKIFIVSLLLILTQNQNHFSRRFNSLIQTSAKTSSTRQAFNILNSLQFRINYRKAKPDNSYTHAITYQGIKLYNLNYCYSIKMYNTVKYASSLQFSLTSLCSNILQKITFRYLIVLSEMSSIISIYYHGQSFKPDKLIHQASNNKIVFTNTFTPTSQPHKMITVFSAFTAKNKRNQLPNDQIDIITIPKMTNSSLSLQITGVSSTKQMYITHLSLYIIRVKVNFVIRNLTGSFEVGSIPLAAVTSSNAYSSYSNYTVFIGTSKIHNRNDNAMIDYYATIKLNSIAITITNQGPLNTYQFSYINFNYLPCNISSTYFYQPNKTCLAACPFVCDTYPAPYLCGTCVICQNGTYKKNNACYECNPECLNCTSQLNCTFCIEKYGLLNGTCVPNCSQIAKSTFLGANQTCEPCSDNCQQCSNFTVCSKCNALFFIDNGNCTINCSQINPSSYLFNQTCNNCSVQCRTCTNLTNCLTCNNLYKLDNNFCILNCTLSKNCLQCNLSSTNSINCTKCSPGLLTNNGICMSKCGDGSYLSTQQQCDDGNRQDGDGCTSKCQVQSQYWTCNSTQGNASQCIMKRIDISSPYILKNRKKNSIFIHISIYPTPKKLHQIQWKNIISINTPQLKLSYQNGYIDTQSSKLIIQYSYSQDLNSLTALLLFTFSNMDKLVSSVVSKQIKVPMIAENNLSLKCYTKEVYMLSMMIEYMSLIIASISLLMFLCGYFSGRLISLQNLAIVQLTFLCLLSIKEANPTFEALRILRVSIGSIPLDTYDYSSSIDPSFKGSYIGLGLLQPPNFSYAIVLLPLMVGVIVNILHRTKWKDDKTVELVSLLFLGEFTFYGLVFSAYFTFSELIVGVLLLSGGNGTGSIANTVASVVITAALGIQCYFLKSHPQYFGVFTKSFSKYGIDSLFYVIVVAERLMSTAIIVLLRDTVFGLAVEFVVILSLFVFTLRNRPFVELNYHRQKINSVSLLSILLLSFLSKVLADATLLQEYTPLGICLLLLVSTVSNLVYLIQSVIKTISQFCPGKSSKSAQDSPSMLQSMFQIKKDLSVQQKNQLQFQIFEQRLFGDSQEINLIFKEQTKQVETSYKNKQILDYEWERYDILTKNKVVEQIRNKLRGRTIATQSI